MISAFVPVCVLRASAPAALDEETDEIEERRVSVLLVKLGPVIDHRLLTHHKPAGLCVLTIILTYPCFVCTVGALLYLHGAPAHSDHLKQGDGLHAPLSAVAAS